MYIDVLIVNVKENCVSRFKQFVLKNHTNTHTRPKHNLEDHINRRKLKRIELMRSYRHNNYPRSPYVWIILISNISTDAQTQGILFLGIVTIYYNAN